MALYAAYGSNMDPLRMLVRAPHSPQAGTGWLDGWRLAFGGEALGLDGAMPMLAEAPGEQVFVVLYDITDGDEAALDDDEGASTGMRRKVKVRVQTLDGDALAWVYVLDAYEGGLPSTRSLAELADAAAAGGAPEPYVEELRARPSAG